MAATAALAIGYATIAAPPETATWRRRGVAGALAVVAVLLGLLVGAVQLRTSASGRAAPGSARMACRTPGPCTRWVCSRRSCRTCSATFFRRRSSTRCPGSRRSTAAASHFSSRSTWVPRCWASALLGALARRTTLVVGVLGHDRHHRAPRRIRIGTRPSTRFFATSSRSSESFRFPVKYLIVSAMAVAALVAAGCDALAARPPGRPAPRFSRAAAGAVAATALIGIGAYAAQAAAIYFPQQTAFRLYDLARFVEAPQSIEAAAFLLHAIPPAATRLIAVALGTALLIGISCSTRRHAWIARAALYVMVSADLITASIGINPTFDARHFDQPAWTRLAAVTTREPVRLRRQGRRNRSDRSGGSQSAAAAAGSVAGREPRRVQLRNRPIPRRLAGARDDLLRPRGPLAAQLPARVPPLSARRRPRSGRVSSLAPACATGCCRRRSLRAVRCSGPLPYFLNQYLYDWNPDGDARAHREHGDRHARSRTIGSRPCLPRTPTRSGDWC